VEAVASVIDRIVLNVLVGNGDAHLKNWAIIYGDGRTATLSPTYDVVPTVLYIPDDDLGLKLGGNRSFAGIQPGSFGRLGERSGFGERAAINRAKDATDRVLEQWKNLRDYLSLGNYASLTRRVSTLALVRGHQI
jgi:serine/threonine-protein kinase HipA